MRKSALRTNKIEFGSSALAHPDNLAEVVLPWLAMSRRAPAIIDGELHLSRGEALDWILEAAEAIGTVFSSVSKHRANDLGWQGRGPGLCAILCPRSWAVPLGLVAIRHAGLAFLPLDTSLPPSRLQEILRRSRPSAVIFLTKDDASGKAVNLLREQSGQVNADSTPTEASAIVIGPPAPGFEEVTVAGIPSGRRLPIGAGHLVFTSGSSGGPKGVILRDGPLLATAKEQRSLLGLDDVDDLYAMSSSRAEQAPSAQAAYTSGSPSSNSDHGAGPGSGANACGASVWALNPGFDASLSDIFTAFLGPAPLAIWRKDLTRIKGFADFLARVGASRADLPPSLMRVVPPERFGLKAVVFGGERASSEAVARWSSYGMTLQAYGPTEAAVCAMMASGAGRWRDGLLGRPLAHQIVLLSTAQGVWRIEPARPDATPNDGDAFNAVRARRWRLDGDEENAEPTIAPGSDDDTQDGCLEGEIWLAGDAVALGYLDNEEATAKRFGQLGPLPVHYTGDVARLKDGYLVWLGRNDRQVKINGRLVCPEEIEAAAEKAWDGPAACLVINGELALALGPCGQKEQHEAEPLIDPGLVLTMISTQLGQSFRPRSVFQLDPWPLSANQKTDYRSVADRVSVLCGAAP